MKYAEISRDHRALKKLAPNGVVAWTDNGVVAATDHYWTAHEAFKVRLQHALKDDDLAQKLTKPQLFQIIAWCSTFRPHEPHVILSALATWPHKNSV